MLACKETIGKAEYFRLLVMKNKESELLRRCQVIRNAVYMLSSMEEKRFTAVGIRNLE